MKSALQRFEEKIIPEPMSGCWLWIASLNPKGYGQFSIDSKQTRAHRASWRLFRGEIPEGMMVLHRCDNRACANPDHLFLGDATINARDMVLKGRAPHQKLTAQDVVEMRRRKANGESYQSMAPEYGIAASTARQAGNKQNWKVVA